MTMWRRQQAELTDAATRTTRNDQTDPYLDARREWNERYGSYIARANNWRLIAFGIMAICLIESVGLVILGTQNKLAPYVVAVDKLGYPVPVARADEMGRTDERVVKALLARFVADVRGVVSDGVAQRQMIDRVYSMLSNGTRALTVVSEFYKADPPFSRAATSGVSIEVSSAIPVTDRTWQVEREEITRSTSGGIINRLRWKASITVAISAPTSERQIRVNPVGVFVTDLNWSQVL